MELFNYINPAKTKDEIEALAHDARLKEGELKKDIKRLRNEDLCFICEKNQREPKEELCEKCRWDEVDDRGLEDVDSTEDYDE